MNAITLFLLVDTFLGFAPTSFEKRQKSFIQIRNLINEDEKEITIQKRQAVFKIILQKISLLSGLKLDNLKIIINGEF